ncbi:hypothetical protein B0J12DRAFT_382460 [Macrophomina phaseolina]|uniref:Secreted protein n=1 Tax=Macrophomina phaseolina TaxID=35725 RepID=A0ABQ8GKY4_9PEZI|nr:hypothetical protein B0J12DRAFT_382460 [Macrophomina phaseolina]
MAVTSATICLLEGTFALGGRFPLPFPSLSFIICFNRFSEISLCVIRCFFRAALAGRSWVVFHLSVSTSGTTSPRFHPPLLS